MPCTHGTHLLPQHRLRDNLGNRFRDFSGHQSVLGETSRNHQACIRIYRRFRASATQAILDRASLLEKKLPADLADLGRALFLEDKEQRFKRLYGARHVQG